MDFTGTIDSLGVDFSTRKQKLSLTVNEDARKAFEQYKDCKELSISITKRKKRRSLDANAYYWVLVGKVADVLKSSNTEVHNRMLQEYGQPEIIDGGIAYFILPENVDWNKVDYIHVKPTASVRTMDNGKLYRVFMVMRGSHTYNTKEMSILIDGIVSEAEHLGIETLPPDELRRMKERWGMDLEKVNKRIYG